MKTDYKKMLLELIGDSSKLILCVSNFNCPEYGEIFEFPKKAITYELGRLLLKNSQETDTKAEIKITSTVFKGLCNGFSKYRKNLVNRADLLKISIENECNCGIAFEKWYINNGFIKTDYYTDINNKIDIIKGSSRIQLKCALILDDSKKAYSTVHSTVLTIVK